MRAMVLTLGFPVLFHAVTANEGDAYRLAALPIGQLVHSIPRYPGTMGKFCRSAGTYGKYILLYYVYF